MSENPYAAPSAPIVSPQKQAIYTRELKSARTILIVVGVIQLLFGIYFMTRVRETFDEAARAEVNAMGSGYQVDPVRLEEGGRSEK